MTPPALVARCPAKLNLALKVLSRRPDGYHELDTVFQAVDLWDRLEAWDHGDLVLECDAPEVPTDGSNLVLKAAALLQEAFPARAGGARLRLSKAIPSGAGLGGGSSDAAGALELLSRLWGVEPSGEQLRAMARELGADVPFFLLGGTARGTGRGDAIAPLPGLGNVAFLLGLPPFGISTAEVFSAVPSWLTLPGNGVSLPAFSGHKWPEENDFGFAENDLEAVVFEGWPELRRFRDALRSAGAIRALLSGSGSTVYGVFRDLDSAECAAGDLRPGFGRWRFSVVTPVASGVLVAA